MNLYVLMQYCFFGFGIYNLFFLVLRKIKALQDKVKFKEIDQAATLTIFFCGLIYLVNWSFDWLYIFINHDSENSKYIINRLNGPYGFSVYAQQLSYITSCLLFFLNFIKKNSFLRFIIGFIFLFNFEKFVIITSSFHRDYLPSSWTMYHQSYGWLIADWLIKTSIFMSFTTITYFVINKNKR
ncbi:hypothetical protein [Flavobacterium lacisediminis]|uniref:Exosortase K n=1 Tax=Flavobacterium lacisediminis TaxID=2989705 RepID=A0ABT3EGE1_9FLAO|nr:hypothetical protein [Flavobacterium lacisediminis]MCW1147634.1 hypothetical protein [Flavobacterium lacisediminis]